MTDEISTQNATAREPAPRADRQAARRALLFDLLLLVVLLAGGALRLSGVFWGEYQYLHPDERFLVWVGSDISPTTLDAESGENTWLSLGEYFDTPNSPLNPQNRGHGFFVYGTLPMFVTRVAVELIFGHSGFQEMTQVGRVFSALADLLAVWLVYAVAARLYDRRVGVLAAAFSAFAVLQIQQSHFFTMDTFVNLLMLLTFYFAVRIVTDPRPWPEFSRTGNAGQEPPDTTLDDAAPAPAAQNSRLLDYAQYFLRHPLFLNSLGFGLAYGMAVASKLNAYPMALALPAAVGLRLLTLPARQREKAFWLSLPLMALAGFLSLVVFRLFQPYAFSGPGFFGLQPNPQWMANLQELRAQASGDVDFPPALQWARRPIWFSAKNMVLWGLGLPFGLLAWSGFLWAGWRMIKGEWLRHALPWLWTAAYFVWQSSVMNPTMRYQLPIYPTLAIFAGWAVVQLYDWSRSRAESPGGGRWARWAALTLGGGALLATAVYATAFTTIYLRPITRVEASRWIYQNVPGPINLRIETEEGLYNQPLPFPNNYTLAPGAPYFTSFTAQRSGELSEIYLPHVSGSGSQGERELALTLSALPNGEQPLAVAAQQFDLGAATSSRGVPLTFTFDAPVQLLAESLYYLTLAPGGVPVSVQLRGSPMVTMQPALPEQPEEVIDLLPTGFTLQPNAPYLTEFTPTADGFLTGLTLPDFLPAGEGGDAPKVEIAIAGPGVTSIDGGDPLADGILTLAALSLDPAAPLTGQQLTLERPVPLLGGQLYTLRFSLAGETISLQGAALANEGEWDDGLPVRLDGYDAFGGIYPVDLNFNMYWDDNPDKLARFLRILDAADYLAISSSRQWANLPRLPERFPLVTTYYRNLLGCPPEQSIESCYNIAQPGLFQGSLGFELVKVFQSDPQLGPLRINDQPSEEAFTVYDHPKVFIFRKTADYDAQRVAEILGAVDFSQVVRVKPMRAGPYPANLMLPADRLAQQRQGGTWSQLFNSQALYNRYPALGAVLWYLALTVLGLAVYPLLRLALPGLADRGYPLARTAGLFLLSYIVWLAGSFQIPAERPVILVTIGLLVGAGAWVAYRQRAQLRAEIQARGRYFLTVEGLFLAFFVFDLLIRVANPDLWHPWKGGEKPMDFAYLNAVLKSTSFPPFDPWFAGGYLNYYYYGFVFTGMLVKGLGIEPAIAYNLIIPTLFAMIAMGAFSVVYNLMQALRPPEERQTSSRYSLLVGGAGAVGMALLGNLGIVRMIIRGYQMLVAPAGSIDGAPLVLRWSWAVQGFVKALSGASLPYSLGDWYWIPSRVIPAPGDVEPITEFPFFTVLYADAHAHLFALPLTLLALAWALSFLLSRGRFQSLAAGVWGFVLGGLAIGALRPTNTWDFYPYLALGSVAVIYTTLVYYRPAPALTARFPALAGVPDLSQRLAVALGGAAALIFLAHVLFQPFAQWYGQGYSEVQFWRGTHTPISAYLTHWGLFLFLIVSWLVWETREWMASTPLAAVRKLEPALPWILFALGGLGSLIVVLLLLDITIAALVLPLAAWAGLLILRPGQPDARRFVLFLVGTGLVLTLMVELIVLRGDIGRMNTVFKFYLQTWTFFSIAAAASLGWIWRAVRGWLPGWRNAWQAALVVLVAAAALYPLLGGLAKARDRMTPLAPHTLDGMAYMAYAEYSDTWGAMDLSQDSRAIQWMLENVEGSPVIVEANLRDLYRWGSRFSIYTGLPGVAGWEWHQQQQRVVVPNNPVSSRIAEIDEFYLTGDMRWAADFLRKYNVSYIILGQQERGKYPGPGLDKFPAAEGVLWEVVYRDQDTVIYRVLPSG